MRAPTIPTATRILDVINDAVKTAMAENQPAISVDTKKKELVGDFKNAGRRAGGAVGGDLAARSRRITGVWQAHHAHIVVYALEIAAVYTYIHSAPVGDRCHRNRHIGGERRCDQCADGETSKKQFFHGYFPPPIVLPVHAYYVRSRSLLQMGDTHGERVFNGRTVPIGIRLTLVPPSFS